jgi:two-component system nitrogen regulation sensor histidine kinase NtrY
VNRDAETPAGVATAAPETAAAATTQVPPPAPRFVRRYRRQVLIGLLLAGLLPLLSWGWLSRSLLEGALALSPPVGSVLQESARALDRPDRDPALAEQLHAAELHVVQADLARRRLLERAPVSFLIALLVAAALIAIGAWLIGRRISRPIETLAAGMARFGRGELDHQVPVSGRGDELDYLAVALNHMGRELARQRARLQVTEALAAWRDAARVLAHDLKNPLTAMRMAVGRLSRPDPTPAAISEAASLLQDELDVLIRMSQSFTEFARLPEPRLATVDLAEVVTQVVALYRAEAPDSRLSLDVVASGRVTADPDQLRRAFGNLIKNALEASRETGGVLTVTVGAGEIGHLRVSVRDEGIGIATPVDGVALMRGLPSAKAGIDRGLGLPITNKIVHDHGGRLLLRPAHPRGTEAVVDLPLAADAAPASPSPAGLRS